MNDQTEYEVFREIWIITERRDGAIFKTRYSHDAWVPMGTNGDPANNLTYATISDPTRSKNPRRKAT